MSLVTPSYVGDLERFALLCESIDRYLTSYERHYVLVHDDEMQHFAKFKSNKRTIIPSSKLLPTWLRSAPSVLSHNGYRVWCSLRQGRSMAGMFNKFSRSLRV